MKNEDTVSTALINAHLVGYLHTNYVLDSHIYKSVSALDSLRLSAVSLVSNVRIFQGQILKLFNGLHLIVYCRFFIGI